MNLTYMCSMQITFLKFELFFIDVLVQPEQRLQSSNRLIQCVISTPGSRKYESYNVEQRLIPIQPF